MSTTMTIHRVINNGEQVGINGADAQALVDIDVLLPLRTDRVAPGFVVHYYRKAD